MIKEITIQGLEAGTDEDLRRILASAFPDPGSYVVERSPVMITMSDRPELGDDPLCLCKAAFPVDGRYQVVPVAEFSKATIGGEGTEFEEWFLQRLFDEARTRYTSSRELMMRVIGRFISDHHGDLSDQETFRAFEDLLFDLRRANGLSIGMTVPVSVQKRLQELGFTNREIFDWPALAYRFGLVYRSVGPAKQFSWDRALALANAVELTETEQTAMVFARQQAALHLSPVVLREPQRVYEEAAAEEQRLIRIMTRQAIRDRGGAMELARDLYKRMEGEGIYRDWERVARTEIAEARSRGSWAVESRNWSSHARLYRETTTRACNACLRLLRNKDGTPKVYTRQEIEEADELGPNRGPQVLWHVRIGQIHPNCHPAGTQVSGLNVKATSERWYEGEVVSVHTASGKHFSVTPNHPVFTPRGEVAAAGLHEGGYVLSSRVGEWAPSKNMDDQEMPSLIEDVAEALRRSLGVSSDEVPLAAEDFHGDGIGSKIAVVRAYGLLRDRFESSLEQQPGQLSFVGVHQLLATHLAAPGAIEQLLKGLLPAANGVVGCLGICSTLGRRELRVAELLSFAAGAWADASFQEAAAYRVASYLELLRERELGIAREVATRNLLDGQRPGTEAIRVATRADLDAGIAEAAREFVAPDSRRAVERMDARPSNVALDDLREADLFADRIAHVSRRPFAGLVYSMTTRPGFYLANGVAVHNCLCAPWQLAHAEVLRPDFGRFAPAGRAPMESLSPSFAQLHRRQFGPLMRERGLG